MAGLIRSLLPNVNRLGSPLLCIIPNRSITTNAAFPTFFRASMPMLAEPLKKKKKIDPAVLRAREERKKKKIERNIKRLEKLDKTLKPVEELSVPQSLIKEKPQRARKESLSQDELNRHQMVLKEWTSYKCKQSVMEAKMIDRITASQQKALDQLRLISEPLYMEAIQIDPTFLPYQASGTTATPPMPNYETPDGDFVDVSPKWV